MNFNIGTILTIANIVLLLIILIDFVFFARARKRKGTSPPGIVDVSRSIFPILFIVLLLRSFVFEPFRIPSGSMMPSLLIGDFILVSKYSYGLHLPMINTKILDTGEPEYGDVVIFRFPFPPHDDYVKRLVAKPGDTVGYADKTLYINGVAQKIETLGAYQGEGSGSVETGDTLAVENLHDIRHQVLIDPRYPDFSVNCYRLAGGPVKVPEGHYFVVGDNRDNSNDSRCWGFVSEKNLVGKAQYIWMHWDLEREGFPINFSRIGTKIE